MAGCRPRSAGRILVVVLSVFLGLQVLETYGPHRQREAVAQTVPESPSEDSLHTDRTDGDEHSGHADPFAFILIELVLVVFVAMLGRAIAGRFRQPRVLGELLIGVVLGNIGYWLDRPFFVLIMHLGEADALFEEVWQTGASVAEAAGRVFSPEQLADGGIGPALVSIMTGEDGVEMVRMGLGLWMFSNLGVILLLFMVGLESSVADMMRVGVRASMAAVLGILVPFGLSFLVGI